MKLQVKQITTPMFLNVTVNSYLITVSDGFILIDTGRANSRKDVENAMLNSGCHIDNLKLIILTHGDFDHCGNAAYLREKYGAPIAMHFDDTGMVEYGDMFWNRKPPNRIIKAIMGMLIRLDDNDRFKPDFYLKEGDNLMKYGMNAEIIEIPGHSKGSIGILANTGDLFCGDLLGNRGKPEVWSIIDDKDAMYKSVDKLTGMAVTTVYPGHGNPFAMSKFLENHQPASMPTIPAAS